jgi:diaminopimelate epimerase
VEFARVLDRQHLEIRIFERGVGPTRSSGTGSSAAAVAAIAAGRAQSPVEVSTTGGKQRVSWAGEGHTAKLTGPASIVAEGVFYFDGD